MKRIIFCDIPMKKDLNAMVYAGTGNINSGTKLIMKQRYCHIIYFMPRIMIMSL